MIQRHKSTKYGRNEIQKRRELFLNRCRRSPLISNVYSKSAGEYKIGLSTEERSDHILCGHVTPHAYTHYIDMDDMMNDITTLNLNPYCVIQVPHPTSPDGKFGDQLTGLSGGRLDPTESG